MSYDSARGVTCLFGGDVPSAPPPLNGETWIYTDPNCDILITEQPVSPQVCQGTTISLHVEATGPGPDTPNYQWRKFGEIIHDTDELFGTNSSTLVFGHANPIDSAAYDCVVTLSVCTATSDQGWLSVYETDSADGNADGLINARDIQPFLDALTNFAPVSPTLCAYDLTGEGIVNLDDLAPFVNRLLAQ